MNTVIYSIIGILSTYHSASQRQGKLGKWKPYRLWSEYITLVACPAILIKRWTVTKNKFSIHGWLTKTEDFLSFKLKNILSLFDQYRYIHLLIDDMHVVLGKYILCETNRNRIGWVKINVDESCNIFFPCPLDCFCTHPGAFVPPLGEQRH